MLDKSSDKQTKVIALAGGTGSGKTTIARDIAVQCELFFGLKACVVSMDNYYKNSNIDKFDNYDHPDAFNALLLSEDLNLFLSQKSVPLRRYSYSSKESDTVAVMRDIDLVILEGLYALHFPEIRQISCTNLYLDIDEETRIERRLKRDLCERNISEEENIRMIDNFVKKMHTQYVSKQKKFANIHITPNNAHLPTSAELLKKILQIKG